MNTIVDTMNANLEYIRERLVKNEKIQAEILQFTKNTGDTVTILTRLEEKLDDSINLLRNTESKLDRVIDLTSNLLLDYHTDSAITSSSWKTYNTQYTVNNENIHQTLADIAGTLNSLLSVQKNFNSSTLCRFIKEQFDKQNERLVHVHPSRDYM